MLLQCRFFFWNFRFYMNILCISRKLTIGSSWTNKIHIDTHPVMKISVIEMFRFVSVPIIQPFSSCIFKDTSCVSHNTFSSVVYINFSGERGEEKVQSRLVSSSWWLEFPNWKWKIEKECEWQINRFDAKIRDSKRSTKLRCKRKKLKI